MDYIIIFDVIIAFLGVYLLYSALQMKRTQKISTLIVNKDVIARCRDKKSFIESVYRKMALFGIISIVFGICGCIDDMVYSFGRTYDIVSVLLYLVAWFLFSREIRNESGKYF